MGQEIVKRGAGGGGALPTTRTRTLILVRQQIQRTFNNIKITLLCGFVTILVLRGYIDLNLSTFDADNQHLIEETNRFLAEIRSDLNDQDDDNNNPNYNNLTYTLGPKITNWDHQRKIWLGRNPEF